MWLSTREHLWSWPTALVNVSLYFVVFARTKLYADMGLQVVYFVLSPDYLPHMDILQAVNLRIVEQFEAAGIEFAFPTQTVHVSGTGERRV